ncbi:MAG: 4Fe-4S binding protein [Slackia sp.]
MELTDDHPEDCVKCGSCRDICPEEAILILDEVKTSYLMDGKSHRYTMTPPCRLDDAAILNTMKGKMKHSTNANQLTPVPYSRASDRGNCLATQFFDKPDARPYSPSACVVAYTYAPCLSAA